MNSDSEQIKFDTSIVLAQDQSLKPKELRGVLKEWLGAENIRLENLLDHQVITYSTPTKKFVLLTKAITYLGNPHKLYKKRIQLSDWYQNFCERAKNECHSWDIRFLGIYHFEENIVFVDFVKDTYLKHGLNNSSAHVSVNDLYEGMTYGIFRKEDRFGNTLIVLRNDKLKDYLIKGMERNEENPLFHFFNEFNSNFIFGKCLNALDAIKEMHINKWSQWRQAEWPGWFLEFRFDKFIKDHNYGQLVRYTGCSNKKEGELDFDLKFIKEDFYGDLKASDIKKKEAPGNDQRNLIDSIYRYKRFWYVIYEHYTRKDSDAEYEATRARNRYIKEQDAKYDKDEMSYHSKMKNSVKFVKMSILELNMVNFKEALKVFNQGHQPDGTPRAPKFNINKSVLENDNFVVFRFNYPFNEEF